MAFLRQRCQQGRLRRLTATLVFILRLVSLAATYRLQVRALALKEGVANDAVVNRVSRVVREVLELLLLLLQLKLLLA